MNFINLKDSEFINARFFLKSPELDGTEGRIDLISENLKNFNVGKFPLIAPSQIHGKNIIIADHERALKYSLPERPEADGIFLMTSKVEASLRFADCAPVLIFPSDEWAAENFSYSILLHSGFKGTVLNIVNEGIEILKKIAGENSVKEANAWCGPCIGCDNYPRALDEWTEKGLKSFKPENIIKSSDGHFYFDIKNEIKNQFLSSGINLKNIYISDLDTFENPECYSYRRGDKKNRMFLHVKIKK